LNVQAVPDVAPQELEGAVDVTSRVAEHAVDEQLPSPGIQQAQRWVGPVAPPTDDQVCPIVEDLQKSRKLAHVELLVPVRHEDQFVTSGIKPASQGRTVAHVRWMRDHVEVKIGMVMLQARQDLARRVDRAVVHNNDFERACQTTQNISYLSNGLLDDAGFVISG
jgi:hypothetical protein